ncbi:sigma-70 family RNA polymerase sigma factor [Actinomycetospora sp. C-140]
MDDARITELALRARDGHRDAAGEFVAATQQQVWRLLVHLADATVAEELAQETYERALGSLRRYRGEAPARNWLLSIARRVAADHLRRRARRPVSPAEPAEDDRPVGRAPRADPAESVAVRDALDGLAADRREAFVLTQVVGLSYEEAAAVCGCPIGTIRSRVARARADLVDALGEPPVTERPPRSG